MSNYFISDCCKYEVKIIDIDNETGVCLSCCKKTKLKVVLDDNIPDSHCNGKGL